MLALSPPGVVSGEIGADAAGGAIEAPWPGSSRRTSRPLRYSPASARNRPGALGGRGESKGTRWLPR